MKQREETQKSIHLFIAIILESFECCDRKLKMKDTDTHSHTHVTISTIDVDIECDNIQSGMYTLSKRACTVLCTVRTHKNSIIKTIGNEFLGDTRFNRLLGLKYVVRLEFSDSLNESDCSVYYMLIK